MIKLLDHGEDKSLIEFTPRYEKRRHPILERQLIYGYWCPRCQNVVQAYFITDKPVDLMIYEVTQILADSTINRGLVDKKLPNKEQNFSCYESVFHKTDLGNGQMIRLRNHTVIWKGHNNKEKWFETGERPCNLIGWKSMNEKTYSRDFEAVYGRVADMGLNPPTSEFVHNWLAKNLDFQATGGVISLKPVGKGIPMLLVPRHALREDVLQAAFPIALKQDWKKYLEVEAAKQKKLENTSVTSVSTVETIDEPKEEVCVG